MMWNEAISLLDNAQRVLFYVGLGARNANVVALAERLQSPAASTFQGKGVFPESHPLSLWPGYGASAPPFAQKIAATCDVTLAIGCRFGEVATGSYGAPPPGKLIHVDIDPDALNRNYKAEIAINVDAAEFVNAMLPHLRQHDPFTFNRERSPATGNVSPHLLLQALQNHFGPDTIFTTDSGNGTFLAVESLILDKPGKLLAPVDYSCMGYAVPAAIGAKLARPDCPVVALAGDGAFLMTGLELLTAANLDVPVAIFVLRDRELAQIAQFQSVALGRKSCSVLPDYDLASIARGAGLDCLTLDSNDVIESTLAKIPRDRPIVIDVAIDYSQKTFFTRGVVKTNLNRLPWPDRLRFIGRALVRRVTG